MPLVIIMLIVTLSLVTLSFFELGRQIIVDFSYGFALLGSGLSVIFKVAGWDDGFKWAGILVVSWVMIRYLLG
jgi:hypothetical protein